MLAPNGWHVATDDDWTILKDYVEAYASFLNKYTPARVGPSMILASKNNWAFSDVFFSPGEAPENNNVTGFTAFPGGYRDNAGDFRDMGRSGSWWGFFGCCWTLSYNSRYLSRIDALNRTCGYGYSVRLVKCLFRTN